MGKIGKLLSMLLGMVATIILVMPVFVSATDGTIDATAKWAWSEKIGWINFGVTSGNVHVTDAGLTGYAWNDLYGWINLNPSTSGVVNNNEGNLSGYAWGENIGWIDFTGVTINARGVFAGTTSGANTGIINFSCTNCSVITDWRPQSSRVSPVSGNVLPPPSYSSPTSDGSIIIEGGAVQTVSTTITVTLNRNPDISYAWISEDSQFINNAVRVNFDPASTTVMVNYSLTPSDGAKTVYAKFCTQWGNCGMLISDSILLTQTQPAPIPPPTFPTGTISLPPAKISPIAAVVESISQLELVEKLRDIAGNLVSQLSKIPKFKLPVIPIAKLYDRVKLWAPYFFKTQPLKSKIPIEQFVSKGTPVAMRGKWEYLDPKPVKRYVFAPLPKDFVALQQKFPEIRNTFKRVGINRLSDIEKISSVQMYLPSLTRSVGLIAPDFDVNKYGAPKSLPLTEMDKSLKEKIPSETVFARAGGQLVDFKIALSLTAKGRAEQKINTISGKPLQLTVKPGKPVKRVRGFVVFRSKKPQVRAEFPFNKLVSSLTFAEPALAFQQEIPVPVEERLVLLEFEYTDPDGDGIYTADIESPIPAGEYEIITVMDYEDPELGSKQIRLITVVDPEGYVYEKIGDKELRVPGAIVTIYYFNPESKSYEEWPAKDFQQENPQITDIRGTYSFLVPGGTYYTKVEAPGYMDYESKPYQVEEGGGVHMNIELRPKYWWLKILDWKTVLLVLVALLLLYNFYKDKQRNRSEKINNKNNN